MEVKLLGAIDYNKLEKLLKEKIKDDDKVNELLDDIKALTVARKSEIVASAGRLSRSAGTVMDILGLSESKSLEQNIAFINMVMGMGHDSISDHDYCVFALKDVSPVVEQTVIEERFSSFTIKSRREVDFSTAGFYVPDFHDEEGNILPNNDKLKEEYKEHMQMLFASYSKFVDSGIPVEDARFVLPYSYHSNIIMGVDAHTLKDLIIKLTKTKYANITELRELGEKLYDIAKENMPYLIAEIDKADSKTSDSVENYLNSLHQRKQQPIEPKTILLSPSVDNIDDTILISAIQRRYQYDRVHAEKVYRELCDEVPDFKEILMKKIAQESDGLELSQVSFQFQTVLSLAILTHLTRHRTHDIITPDFVPNLDLTQYKTPPKIKIRKDLLDCYDSIYALNKEMYDHFKNDYGVREEDLIYFTLSGTLATVVTNIDGKSLHHIVGLRACGKAQWETQAMARGMQNAIKNLDTAGTYSSILGPSCETEGICREGKESCGRINNLPKTFQKKKNPDRNATTEK